MKTKIAISTIAAFFLGLMFGPPDPLTLLVLGVEAAFFCAVPLLILARRDFVKSASGPVHTLVCVLVCMVALLSVECLRLTCVVSSQQRRIGDPAEQLNEGNSVASAGLPDARS